MATNYPVIPPIGDKERISDWRILFEASTEQIRAQDEGEKRVIQMLPAYINRTFADRECVREVTKTAQTAGEALDALVTTLDPPTDQYSSRQALCRLTWQPGESIDCFFFKVKRLAAESGVDFKFAASLVASQLPRAVEGKIKAAVVGADGDLESAASRKLLTDIKRELNDHGHALDKGNIDLERIVKVAAVSDQISADTPEPDSESGLATHEQSVAYTQHQGNWKRRTNRAQPQHRQSGCYVCGEDHLMRYCPQKCCPVCGTRGHSLSNCPRKKTGPKQRILQVNNRTLGSELSVILPVKLANAAIEMILDSGAGPSVIDLGTVRYLGLEREIILRAGTVYGVGQNPVHLIGNIALDVDLGDNQIARHSFGVLADTNTTRILGRDLLRNFGPTEFDWDSHRVRLGSVWKDTRAILQGGDAISRSAVAALETETNKQVHISRGFATERERPKVSINPELPEGIRRELGSLVNEFSDVFAHNPKSPTVTPLAKHAIHTGDNLPVKNKQRRVSPSTQTMIDVQITEMLRNGICSPSNSPWSSPVILITKKDGGTRFVVDYRGLNDLTRKDAYPMPNPRDILDTLLGDNYFSSLDCASAYWAVGIEAEDQPKTAFSTPRGHFEMTRMAFGLCNSQATYQRLMDQTLHGVRHSHSYVDDVLIHSPSMQLHINDIREALTRLRRARIQLRADKCRLGYQQIEFVGHLITPSGHKPLASNVEKIVAYEPPKDKLELQRFLGLVNFYRDYIPNMATIAEPLYALTRKGVPYSWNQACYEAFRTLTQTLTRDPVLLSYPDWDSPFYLQTDASRVAAGGVLSQLDANNKLRPLAFYSTGLNASQRNYAAGEIECWALIALSRKFRDYLKAAQKIIFISDHNPLRWLRRQRDPRGKFVRWIQELEGWNYEIRYVKGADNAAADFLSRIDSEVDHRVNDEYEFMDRLVYNIPTAGTLYDELRSEQTLDPAIAFAAEQLTERGVVSYGRYRNQRLAFSNTLVTREDRILVPEHFRNTILTRIHNASHPGIKRTLHLLKRQFTWDGIHRDTRAFCKACNVCQREKSKNKTDEPLKPIRAASKPRQMIAYDVATLPWGNGQFRYFLIITDLFSKWVEIAPMPDQTSSTILVALNMFWFYRHGLPEAVLSDQGPNVDGAEIRRSLDSLGVKKVRSSPYHPQGDGQAERNIQTVKQTLRCILSQRELTKECWPEVLQEVAYTINTLPNSGTKLTPFHIMHGTEPTPNPRLDTSEGQPRMTPDSWYEEASHGVERSVVSARTSLQNYQDAMKRTFDKGRKETTVAKGDYVYLRNDAKSDSLDSRYNGPFLVVNADPPNVTVDMGDGRRRTVHLNRCKVTSRDANSPYRTVSSDGTQQEHLSAPQFEPDEADEANTTERSSEQIQDLPMLGADPAGTPTVTRHGRVIQKPLRYRDTLIIWPTRGGSDVGYP